MYKKIVSLVSNWMFLDIGKSWGTFSAKARGGNIEEDREGERERTRGKLFRVTINIPRRRRRRKRGAKRFLLLLLNGYGGLPSPPLPPKNAGLYVRATPPGYGGTRADFVRR